MKFLLRRGLAGGGDCRRWEGAAETDALDGPLLGAIDHYALELARARAADARALYERARDLLFVYRLFPPDVMSAAVCSQDGKVRPGTTIVQRVTLGLVGIESAVRVKDVWERTEGERTEAGFAYVTLAGHAEQGVASFRVVLDQATGSLNLLIDSRSRPGSLLTAVGRPFARRFQQRATRRALVHFKALLMQAGD